MRVSINDTQNNVQLILEIFNIIIEWVLLNKSSLFPKIDLQKPQTLQFN
jgi:hypothetical protein